MSTSLDESPLKTLEINPEEGVVILLKLLENVIKDPENNKYRKIRLENKIIKEKLLSLGGIEAVLKYIGFEELVPGELHLPGTILIAQLKKYRDYLNARLEVVRSSAAGAQPVKQEVEIKQVVAASSTSSPSAAAVVKPKLKKKLKIVPLKSYRDRITFPRVITSRINFLEHLESSSDSVMQFEDDKLQYYGRKCIPIERLTDQAIEQMRQQQKLIQSGIAGAGAVADCKEPCFTDLLLVQLTNWFNTEFFTWVNTMPCKKCKNEDILTRGSYMDNGIRVETYTCCNETSKFYRYNDVATLLQTRRGRCGEYANCFTFLCRCLGYEARMVTATFDHVWTEVFSVGQKRWIHIDPSDNVVDAPLMYQYGWKRNIDYIIAFSKDEVQDVTNRYTNDHNGVKSNRTKCTEAELLNAIMLLRQKRQSKCSIVRKKYLAKRALFELVELMTPKAVTENEKKGRSSGSLSWKLSRGEQNVNSYYVFNADAAHAKQFNVRYSCAKNNYEQYILCNDKANVYKTDANWETCHYLSTNIFRKLERDWKMVYLARSESSDAATISWNFDFTEQNLKIKSIFLKFETKTYENGKIDVEISNGNGLTLKSITDVIDLSKFSIKATLSGGVGDCAWQHAQLFRQRSDSNEYPFELKITFY